jgi:hypothetical protein
VKESSATVEDLYLHKQDFLRCKALRNASHSIPQKSMESVRRMDIDSLEIVAQLGLRTCCGVFCTVNDSVDRSALNLERCTNATTQKGRGPMQSIQPKRRVSLCLLRGRDLIMSCTLDIP